MNRTKKMLDKYLGDPNQENNNLEYIAFHEGCLNLAANILNNANEELRNLEFDKNELDAEMKFIEGKYRLVVSDYGEHFYYDKNDGVDHE